MGISTGDAPIGPFPSLGKTQEQGFKADVDIKPNEEGGPSSVTLSNIREVKAITFADGDHGDIGTATYETFDITAVQLGLATGATVFIEVRPGDSIPLTPLTYTVNSLDKDPKTGAVTLNAWAIRRSLIPPSDMLLFGATVSVTMVAPAENTILQGACCVTWAPNSNSETGKLTIAYASGDAGGVNQIFHPAFLINLFGLIKRRVPVVIEGKRAGCKNVKTMIGFLDRICDDGKCIELRISKKGLKSKGCAAKKAVAGFKEGAYELQSIKPVRRGYFMAGSSNPGDLPGDLPGFMIEPFLWGAGTLRNTGNMGEYQFEFAVNAKNRVFSYDEEKNEVSSISANDYLVQVAQSIGRVPPLAGIDFFAPARFETAADRSGTGLAQSIGGRPRIAGVVALVRIKPVAADRPVAAGAVAGGAGPVAESGAVLTPVFLTGLTRSNPGDQMSGWSAKVKTSLADAEKLGDETPVDGFSFNFPIINIPPSEDNFYFGGARPSESLQSERIRLSLKTRSIVVLRILPVPVTTTIWWFFSVADILNLDFKQAVRADNKLYFYGEDLSGGIRFIGISINADFVLNFETAFGVKFNEWVRGPGINMGFNI
jgi:hypothetical protein